MSHRIGEILGGSYRIEKLLGEGGMGTVYEAAHLRVPRSFAVKILNREVVGNRDIFDRFRREAEITSALGNKHIVQVFDFNHAEDGAPFMVLELLQGEDLARRLLRVKRLTLEQTASILDQTASALEAAHAAGVVHRDLKPGNLFLIHDDGRDDFVKVLDFGISKMLHGLGAETRTGVVFGTPNYMAPEQAQGLSASIDGRTDLFSLATILYECLTGQLAFQAETPFATAYQVCHGDPKPLRSLAPEIPVAVEKVVHRALGKRNDQRFGSAVEMRDAFFSACRLVPSVWTRPTVAPVSGSSPSGPRTAMSAEAQAIFRPARKRWAAVGAVSLALALGLIAVFQTSGRRGSPEAELATVALPAPSSPPAPPSPRPGTAAAPEVPPVAEPPPVEAPAVPATVLIHLDLDPADARVDVDGHVTSENPLRLPRGDIVHTLTVTAPGHRAVERDFRTDTDGRIEVKLERAEPQSRRPARRSRPKRKVRGPVETDL